MPPGNGEEDRTKTGLRTVVTWTLTPTETGTHLRVEQLGFRPRDAQSYRRASRHWKRCLAALQKLLEQLDKEDAMDDIAKDPTKNETKSIIVERLIPHGADKVWRALTFPHLVAEWLMENDFAPVEGHRFTFRAKPVPGWSGVTNCVVLRVEPPRLLAYSWGDGSESESGLKTVVTWSLTPEGDATRVRMEQSGFRTQDEPGYKGMGSGWPRILERLEQVAAGQG